MMNSLGTMEVFGNPNTFTIPRMSRVRKYAKQPAIQLKQLVSTNQRGHISPQEVLAGGMSWVFCTSNREDSSLCGELSERFAAWYSVRNCEAREEVVVLRRKRTNHNPTNSEDSWVLQSSRNSN